MKILIIKTSSMGDVTHNLPAIYDIKKKIKNIKLDWIVEKDFEKVIKFTDNINNLITINTRNKKISKIKHIKKTYNKINKKKYNLVIDSQGLIKSAIITILSNKKKSIGLGWKSAKEPLSTIIYKKNITINNNNHAVTKIRLFFAKILKYKINIKNINFGINKQKIEKKKNKIKKYIIFLYHTTWETKHWPKKHLIILKNILKKNKLKIKEIYHSKKILELNKNKKKTNINKTIQHIYNSKCIITVDTGFGHIASAIGIPTISIYGPTSPQKSGMIGKNQINIMTKNLYCSPCFKKKCLIKKKNTIQPCFKEITPLKIWENLLTII